MKIALSKRVIEINNTIVQVIGNLKGYKLKEH